LILSVDRLDYTKAIPPRLEAFGRLLDENPQYREQVSLIQLLDVSRSDIPAYQEELEKVERITAGIQQRYPQWQAIYLSAERWDRPELAGLMRIAPICVVTPRVDGMNLVSKEYVAAAPDDGALVLSHQAGAAWQLGRHAVLVDGNSPESIAAGLQTALTMPPAERRERMTRLKEIVRSEDVYWWANQFVTALKRQAARGRS
jgi:trehalose-6-phosphate synthase